MNVRNRITPLLAALAAAAALAACDRGNDGQTAGQQADPAVAQADAAKADAGAAMAQGEQALKDGAAAAKQAGTEMADGAPNVVADAAITTSVNAELAKDPQLSALDIDVDTAEGRVALKGSAPTQADRERATQLASAVKGVISVDNQLQVSDKM